MLRSAIKTRIQWITYGTYIAIGCIIVRLAYLQIQYHNHFFSRSEQNFLRLEHTPCTRGNIVDRNGTLFATNRPVINIYWQGSGAYHLDDEKIRILTTLEHILGKPFLQDPLHRRKVCHAERHFTELLLAQDISVEQLGKIEELFPADYPILIKHHFKRFYPHGAMASHIIGYLQNPMTVEPTGKMGLEKIGNQELKGTNGTILQTINSVGKKMHEQPVHAALHGTDLVTTIDFALQQLCEEVFPKEYSGAFILMEPNSGDIISLVSRPQFDPNLFLEAISTEAWGNLQQDDKPFLNRTIQATYPPGSIFKLVTLSAALEHNLIDQHSTWYCNGFTPFCNRDYWCHCKEGHGRLTMTQCLAQSCNTLCFEIAKKIDVDTLSRYAHMFGLGEPTNIVLPEKTGLIPNRSWKREARGEPWWPGETLSVSIGQSFSLVTPMQVACMISGIFTGYVPRPRILLSEEQSGKKLTLQKDTLDFLRRSMKQTVQMGTGKQINTIKDLQIYAKTSTAQTSSLEKRNMGLVHMEHGWFVAHLNYKDYPALTMVILVEHAGSSRVATTIAKHFLIEYKKLVDNRAQA